MENVYAVDAVIGDIVNILKDRGDYDSSMIIIMSDHPWKYRYSEDNRVWAALDPGKMIPEKHIPFIIKYPGQQRGGEWTEPFFSMDVHPLIDDFWNNPEQLMNWVNRWNAGEVDQAWYHAQ